MNIQKNIFVFFCIVIMCTKAQTEVPGNYDAVKQIIENLTNSDFVVNNTKLGFKENTKILADQDTNSSDRVKSSEKANRTSISIDKLLYYFTEICNIFLATIVLGGVLVFFLAWDERKQFNRVNKVRISLENLNFRAQIHSGVTSTDECSICYESYEKGEFFCVLRKCRHKFHLGCLQKWVYHQQCDAITGRNDVTCPLCRTSIVK